MCLPYYGSCLIWQVVLDAMRSIGFTDAELNLVWTFLGIVVHLGNVNFGGGAEEASVQQPSPLPLLATLLHCDARTLGKALTTKMIKAGNDWITSPVTVEVAENVRDQHQ